MFDLKRSHSIIVLIFFAISIGSCHGSGSNTNPTITSAYDGSYVCNFNTSTLVSSNQYQSTVTCSNGNCSDTAGALAGAVYNGGNFSGTFALNQNDTPFSMSGIFSNTAAFTINGQSSGASETISCINIVQTYPTVSGFTPTSGTPGTLVTIMGTNLSNSDTVSVCGVTAVVTSGTSTQIITPIPAISSSSTCSITVTATTAMGNTVSATATGFLSVTIPPSITSLYWLDNGGTVSKVGTNGGVITTLATGLRGPISIAVDSTNVYWTDSVSGGVSKVGINGGSVITLATGSQSYGIAVDSTDVYWVGYDSNGVGIKKVGLNGGAVTTLATDVNSTSSIAVDSTSVYWTVSFATNDVNKVGLNGGTVTTLATDSYPGSYGIAVDDTSVYWKGQLEPYIHGSFLKKVGLNGGTVTTLANSISIGNIVLDSTSVYWTETPDRLNSVGLFQIGKNGGTVTTILSTGLLSPIAVDSTSVYWATNETVSNTYVLNKIGKSGGTVTPLANVPCAGSCMPNGIALGPL